MSSRILKRKETQERHEGMTPKCLEAKIDKSKLTKQQNEAIKLMFIEAKWLRNYFLSQEQWLEEDCKKTTIPVKVGEVYEDRALKCLPAQAKQSVRTGLIRDATALKRRKEAGYKIGRLKYKSWCSSVELKQFDNTYKINFKANRIRIASVKGWIKVRGLDQLLDKETKRPLGEIASAKLISRPSGYYLHITLWCERQIKEKKDLATSIAGDGGCDKALTLSNGVQVDWAFPVPDEIKRLDRKIMKKHRPDSKNKKKDQGLRRKLYEKNTNRKQDTINKVVSVVKDSFDYHFFQNENIKGWQASNHGKKVQSTGLGKLFKALKSLVPDKPVSRFFPSTQLCPRCGHKRKLSLSERIYTCYCCGYTEHRDLKSAQCIEYEGLRQLGTEYTTKLGEESTSAEVQAFMQRLDLIPYTRVSKLTSLSQEAPLL